MSFPYNSDEEECATAEYGGIDNTIDLITDNDNISIVATISDESSYASTNITPASQQIEYIFDLTENDDTNSDDTSSADINLLDKSSSAESDVTTPVIHDNRPNMNVTTSSKMMLAKKIICKSCLNFMVMYTNYKYSRCVFCNNAI